MIAFWFWGVYFLFLFIYFFLHFGLIDVYNSTLNLLNKNFQEKDWDT